MGVPCCRADVKILPQHPRDREQPREPRHCSAAAQTPRHPAAEGGCSSKERNHGDLFICQLLHSCSPGKNQHSQPALGSFPCCQTCPGSLSRGLAAQIWDFFLGHLAVLFKRNGFAIPALAVPSVLLALLAGAGCGRSGVVTTNQGHRSPPQPALSSHISVKTPWFCRIKRGRG